MQSKHTLFPFIEYCLDHKDERFWQALRNFMGVKAIYIQENGELVNTAFDERGMPVKIEDTFYIE